MSKWIRKLVVMTTAISLLIGSCEPWRVVAAENNRMVLGENVTEEIIQGGMSKTTEEIVEVETETITEAITETETETITEAITETEIEAITEAITETEIEAIMAEMVKSSEDWIEEETTETIVSQEDEEDDEVETAYANPLMSMIISEIRSNYDVYEDGYYRMVYETVDGYEYKVSLKDSLDMMSFSAKQGDTGISLGYSCDSSSLITAPAWFFVGSDGVNMITIEMNVDLNMSTYQYGDILKFIQNPLTIGTAVSQNSSLYRGSIQEDANQDFKRSMYQWNYLLHERTGYSLVDLGFEKFEEESTDDWEEYFSNNIFVNGVTLNKTSLSLEKGKTSSLMTTVTPSGADNKNVIWSSTDENIVTVSETGVVHAVNDGTAKVIVKTVDGEFGAQCQVTVSSYSEHYTCVRSGEQEAKINNMSEPQTIWMKSNATYRRYRFYDPVDYSIRMEEMYLGAKAAQIIKEENHYNETPTSSQQWFLIKFYLENRGNDTLEASDVIGLDGTAATFYTRTGASISPESASLSGERRGKGIYDVNLEPGAAGYVWIGVLLDKSVGFPYLRFSNGYDEEEKKAKYVWFDTDPRYGIYRVNFDGNGGEITQAYKEVSFGGSYGNLPVPVSRPGYDFVGWSTNSAGTKMVTEDSMVSVKEDHTLYAIWSPRKYMIFFDGNGGVSNLESLMVTYGTNYGNLPDAVREGYSFTGWYSAPEGGQKIEPDAIIDFTEDKTVYAQWTANEYVVTFDSCGGNQVEPQKVTFDSSYGVLPSAVEKRGYRFTGWYTQPEGGEPVTEEIIVKTAQDHKLYAQWIGNEYTVTFDFNGGIGTAEDIQVVFGNTYGTLPEAESEEGFFSGWYTEADGGVPITEYSVVDIDRNHTLYARYGNIATTGIELDQSLILIAEGEEKQINAKILPDDASDQRVRWNVSDGEIASVTNGVVKGLKAGRTVVTAISVNGAYEAVCVVEVLESHMLTFMNGDKIHKTLRVLDGETASAIEIPEGIGTFVGWYADGKLWDVSSPVSRDMVLTARFIDVVSEEIQSGTSAMDTQPQELQEEEVITLVKGQKFVLPGTGWESTEKKIVSVNKAGAVNAKKVTYYPVELVRKVGSKLEESLSFIVVQPVVDKKLSLIAGQSKQISVENSENLNVYWTSAAPDIAAVGSDGTVRGISKGNTVVTAYINGVAFNCNVKVTDADTSKRDFTANVKLVPMQSITFKSSGFNVKKAVWSSDLQAKSADTLAKGIVYEDAVVRITKTGKITAIGCGKTTLTAVSLGNTRTFTVEVSAPATQIIHLNVNGSKNIKIYGTKGTLNWKSSEQSIVQINKNKIKGLKPGTTTLTAEYENLQYKVIVYIEDSTLTNKQLTGKYPNYKLAIRVGEKILLEEKQVYQSVLYRSNKNNIAFVDENGILVARSRGVANVTAKVNGKQIKIKVTVF